jgi:protein TonB
MRDSFLRSLSTQKSANPLGDEASGDSWLHRVRDNLAQLLLPSSFKASAANGAPLHLLQFERSPRPASAQGASLLTHVAAVTALILFLANGPHIFRDSKAPNVPPRDGTVTISAATIRTVTTARNGGCGGNNDVAPAKRGDLPPLSKFVLVKPSLPMKHDAQLLVAPTLLDANAAAILAPTPDIGLPWMNQDTNSGGPGKGHTLGSVGGNHLGDSGDGPAGEEGGSAVYGPNFIAPMCAYCPYPTYSDDARKAKVQGAVTLRVLVGADGRTKDVRIIKGIGFGLEERAIEAVRNWKFNAARDSAKRPVASWITVEAVFRLF